MDEQTVTLTVNGHSYTVAVEPRRLLADVLREDLGLTGTHLACEHGVCGACTILLEGRPVRSCLMLAVQADAAELTTVEALASSGELHPLQQAFWDHHALQCGFCTPGFLMSGYALLRDRPDASVEEIEHALEGNLCRCTGYQNIIAAVVAARDAHQAGRGAVVA